MGFTVFKRDFFLWDYYLSRRGSEEFSNAFDVPECKHNLRLLRKGRALVLLFRAAALNCGGQDKRGKKNVLTATWEGFIRWSRKILQ